MKSFLVSAALLAGMLLAAPAMAAGFVGAKCEAPAVKELLLKNMKSMRIEGGYNASSYGVDIEAISKAETVKATTKKLICKLLVRTGFRGEHSNIRGLLIITAFSGDRALAEWQPFR